jgi:hypothetical protein
MSTGYLREWASAAIVNDVVVQVPRGIPLRVQKVTFSTTTQFTNAIGDDCALAELWVGTDACVAFGTNPTATTDNGALTAKTHFFFQPPPGGATKIALIDYA